MPENEDQFAMLYRASAAPDGGHLQEGDWERLACGELQAAEKEKAIDHVTRCAECARIYRGIDALTEGARSFDPGVPAATARVLAFPRALTFGGLAAAAAVAVFMLRPAPGPQTTTPQPGDGFRGSPASQDPAALSPRGATQGAPAELRWQGIAAPARYRVVVLDAEGERVWSSDEVEGTTMAWPAELRLEPGAYFWQVIALPRGGLPGDRRASALAAFEVVTSSRP